MDYYKIKLILIPKEAHFKMGTVERLHAVRRLQLLKMKKEMPNIDLQQAIPVACAQRNRLRNIHGSSPAELVFGKAPNALSGLLDEPHDLRPDLPKAAQDLVVLRTLAAKAFHEANNDAFFADPFMVLLLASGPMTLGWMSLEDVRGTRAIAYRENKHTHTHPLKMETGGAGGVGLDVLRRCQRHTRYRVMSR